MHTNYNFSVYLNSLRQKGNLAFEYNPLYNFQTDVDLYKVDDKYIVPYGQAVNTKNGELLIQKDGKWVDKRGMEISQYKLWSHGELWAKSGSLIDLDTEKLNFDLNHPVEIEVQPSYDGSVNLILNDDKNIPRLINSRFSVREKNTYEIVDRIGENDTNIYNSRTFDKDTSLYFQYEYNPKITYLGFIKGNFGVGQYCFYFTYCDADDNESDIIAESGLIPVFIGNDSDPNSMDGGIKNQLSDKGVRLKLTDIDKSYNYFKVYYVRYFADYEQNRVYECKKIYQKYPINSNTLYLNITGFEDTEELDPNILNISRFNPKSILTQAQCKNMLFFGNIVKNSDNYKELTDLALRIVPELNVTNDFKSLDEDYISQDGNYAYYNSLNIYNKTGYFNQEYYRFGVVFIYQNGTLSNVYNTLGGTLDENNSLNLTSNGGLFKEDSYYLIRNYIKCDEFGWVKEDGDNYALSGENINSKGVCHITYNEEYDDNTIFSVRFRVPKEVSKFLKEDLGIRGFFFVRQKCVPNIIAQCYLMPMDEQSQAPVLEYKDGNKTKYVTECFLSQSQLEEKEIRLPISGEIIKTNHTYGGRIVTNDYNQRIYEFDQNSNSISKKAYAAICPDFLLNQPYYNQIFNGGKFKLQRISKSTNTISSKLIRDDRFYKEPHDVKYSINDEGFRKVSICSVTDNVRTVAIKDKIYRLEMGKAEEVYRFRFAENDTEAQDLGKDESKKDSCNLIRGMYSPYLAVYSNSGQLETGCLYNIYQDTSISTQQEFLNRMNSSEPFYAISDRHNLVIQDQNYICYRGDCYINRFTYRLNRNFNDSSLPNNDQIIDPATWYSNYDNPDDWTNISRSDVNAVQMGSWITISVRSAMNYALRSVDHSFVSEEALMGAPRSFYPKSHLLFRGENKIPDSYLYNDAYRATLGYKCYFTLQDINYVKDTFSNRIQYSAVSIQDSYKNNYRYSLSTYYRDYSQEYGSIQKLVEYGDGIIVVFEHGIGFAAVNERVLAGQGEGGPVFINADKVLPEELQILSNTYGTQWGDSVVKSEAGIIYGVDTVAKKIWRIRGNQIDIISDFKVNKFLINNITLSERELYPTIGLRNVKTHYNNNKKDIIFTFYDDVYKDEERVWSLCFNELMPTDGLFTTFYSWVPSFSENIDTQFFTFDRTTSKYLALLNKCNYSVPENQGILLDNPVIDDSDGIPNPLCNVYYTTINKNFSTNYTVLNQDGTKSIKSITIEGAKDNQDRYIFNKYISYKIEEDHWGNYKLFDIENGFLTIKSGKNPEEVKQAFQNQKVIVLYITPMTYDAENIVNRTAPGIEFGTEAVAFTLDSIVKNPLLTTQEKKRQGLTTDFYLHGKAGIFNVVEDLYPTHWYGKYHPFEFEFVVNDKLSQQKIFTDLIILSNKAEPESFHFEIEGDNYDFSPDKRNMYFRQEATKNLYQNLGSDILYDRYFTDVIADNYTHEQYYRANPLRRDSEDIESNDYIDSYRRMDKVYPLDSQGLVQQVKSTIFPLYYERIDTYDDIYHKYRLMNGGDEYDFKNLSGSEVKWDRDLNQFNIVTHIKNNPIDHYGVLRGNSKYKEGKWNIQIPAISFMQKNEGDTWQEASSIPNTTPITVPGLFVLADCNGEGGSKLCGNDSLGCDTIQKDYFILADCNGEGGSHLCDSNVVLFCESINDYSDEYSNAKFDKDPENFTLGASELNSVDTLVCEENNEEPEQQLLGSPRRNIMRGEEVVEQVEEEIKNEILKYKIPPIVINSSYLPNDLETTLVKPDKLPNIYNTITDYRHAIQVNGWTYRKETKIRDKWVKIRVRYSGKNLAVIHSLITLYNISYS